jgi:hypothetical protein
VCDFFITAPKIKHVEPIDKGVDLVHMQQDLLAKELKRRDELQAYVTSLKVIHLFYLLWYKYKSNHNYYYNINKITKSFTVYTSTNVQINNKHRLQNNRPPSPKINFKKGHTTEQTLAAVQPLNTALSHRQSSPDYN